MTTNLTRTKKSRNKVERSPSLDREKPLNGILSFRRDDDEKWDMYLAARDGVYSDED
jgi:hypothetical protein